jgi:hypothetical protein
MSGRDIHNSLKHNLQLPESEAGWLFVIFIAVFSVMPPSGSRDQTNKPDILFRDAYSVLVFRL